MSFEWLSTFRDRSRAAGLLPRACGMAVVCELALRAGGVRRTLSWIDRRTPARHPAAPQLLVAHERAATWAYRLLPLPDTCLRRSMVEYWLGRRAGMPVRLVIGVRAGGEFGAHAWIESGESARQVETFEEIFVHGAPS